MAFSRGLLLSAVAALACLARTHAAECTAVTGTLPLSQINPGEWRVMRPGGTKCSDGSEFAFLVRRGAVGNEDVVVEFQGGGACWSSLTCGLADAKYKSVLPELYDLDCTSADYMPEGSGNAGIGAWDDASNTWAGATMVFVPYCTQDLHWGDVTMEYNFVAPFTFEHHGRKNVEAVLDWTFQEIPDPARVFVEGCSAGGYGALVYSAYFAENYKNSRAVISLGIDSAFGIMTDAWVRSPMIGAEDPTAVGGFRVWNPECAFPRWLSDLGIMQGGYWNNAQGLRNLITNIAEHYSDMRVFWLSSNYDSVQVTFYQFMGAQDGADGWSLKLRESMIDVSRAPNVKVFAVEGTHHCDLLFSLAFRTNIAANNVMFKNWLMDFSDAATVADLPDSQICAQCGVDTVAGCDGVMGSRVQLSECGVCGGSNDDCASVLPPLIDPATDPNHQCSAPYFPVVAESGCSTVGQAPNCMSNDVSVTTVTEVEGAPSAAARAVVGALPGALDAMDNSLCGKLLTTDAAGANAGASAKVCVSRKPDYTVDIKASLTSCSDTSASNMAMGKLEFPAASCPDASNIVFGSLAETHALNSGEQVCGCM